MTSTPNNNRFWEYYESFYNTTPLTTRIVLTTSSITYLASFLYDPTFIFANIPAFTILRVQLYRIITSSFICTELLSLIFVLISFMDYGKRIESGIGSTNFAALLLTISSITNITHDILCLLAYFSSKNAEFLFLPCTGIWNLILGVIAAECATADIVSQRRLFVVDVPTRYYPCALLGFFILFSGGQIHISYFISVGIGYLIGFGKLDFMKLTTERRQRLESGVLRKFTSKVGFVAGPNRNLWNFMPDAAVGGDTQATGTGSRYPSDGSSAGQAWSQSVYRNPNPNATTNSTIVSPFEGTTGKRLGSAVGSARSRPNAMSISAQSNPGHTTVDRAVLLAAAEKRAAVRASTITDEEKCEEQ